MQGYPTFTDVLRELHFRHPEFAPYEIANSLYFIWRKNLNQRLMGDSLFNQSIRDFEAEQYTSRGYGDMSPSQANYSFEDIKDLVRPLLAKYDVTPEEVEDELANLWDEGIRRNYRGRVLVDFIKKEIRENPVARGIVKPYITAATYFGRGY